jgi:hypothetical protein
VAVILLAFALRLARDPLPNGSAEDVDAQLAFLERALNQGAAEEMQSLFPEGYFFMHALVGLAHVDHGLDAPLGSPDRLRARDRALVTLEALESAAGRAPFFGVQSPPNGMFFQSWTAYLRAGTILLDPQSAGIGGEITRLQGQLDGIREAVDDAPTPFPESYLGAAWPCDSYPSMVAMRVYDVVAPEPRYGAWLEEWLDAIDTTADGRLGVPSHRIDPADGSVLEGPRATSLVLITRFMADIDPVRGEFYYRQLRGQYLTTVMSLPGFREHPHGSAASGDIDSGPLIGGISLSASAVGAGASLVWGDDVAARSLFRAGEAFGMPIRLGGVKRYAFGMLPIGDAFGVWSKTARPWLSERTPRAHEARIWNGWRWPWWVTIGVVLPLLLFGVPKPRGQGEPSA